MTEKALSSLSKRLTWDRVLTTEIASTRLARQRNTNRQDMLSDLESIGKSGSLESMVAAEKTIVKFDLQWHANSKSMETSLKTAEEELGAIETNIGLVGDPAKYKYVDASHAQRRTRDDNDLPKDGARIAFRSHLSRLGNYDKTKSDDHEKAIIRARQKNISSAEKLYIERQEKALGREPGEQRKEPAKARPRTLTREEYKIALDSFIEKSKNAPGMTPQKLAAIRTGIEQAIEQKAGKRTTGERPAPRKTASRDDQGLER
jgi:hypothetical protein